MRTRALIGATLTAWALLPGLALVASADEDPPLPSAEAGPPLRPPITVLRATVSATPAPTPSIVAPDATAAPRKELIVLVGGLGTHLRPEDNPFGALQQRVPSDAYDVKRFGTDVGVYDTYDSIDRNARELRDVIRAVSGDYDAVHIVTHSLGGVVADRAFALGLSSSDGVTTYVAWAAPHNGAHAAQVARAALTLSGPAREDTRDLAKSVKLHDPEVAAVRDLASVRAAAPPAGVVRLDLRMATDALVSSRDARDPDVDSRVLLPDSPRPWEWEGHGGILRSQQALDLTLATIRQKAVPADDRGMVLRAASEVISDHISERVDRMSDIAVKGLCVLVLVGGVGALLRRTLRRGLPWPPLFA
jgi:hypothetical protein